jgi:hypothetical protein
MADQASNDVFISYRRDVGGYPALALFQGLTERGIDAFYDIESIRTGEFGSVILGQIEARPYFILILTPGTLERCSDPGDWLCQEIKYAVAKNREIVPAYTPSFDFGDCERFLPHGLGQKVLVRQAQELPQKWFKSAVQQLVDEYLLPKVVATTTTPATHQRVLERIRRKAKAAETITSQQLSAQDYVERAYRRRFYDVDGKIADYTQAIRLDPGFAVAFNNRGIARKAKGDRAGAKADRAEAHRLDPTRY